MLKIYEQIYNGKLAEKVVLTILALIGMFTLYTKPVDPDYGWHYKSGEYFWQTGRVIRDNIFSYNMVDYKWPDSYWLFEVILYKAEDLLGQVGASALFGLLLSIALLYYLKKYTSNLYVIGFSFFIFIMFFGGFHITVRPQLFSTIIFLYLTKFILDRNKNLFILPPLFLLWTNLHADFTIGMFVVGFYLFEKAWREYKEKSYRELTYTLTMGLLMGVVTFINPFGVDQWRMLLYETTAPIRAPVAEFKSPLLSLDHNLLFFLIYLLLIVSGLTYYFVKKPRLSFFAATLLLCLFSLKAIYFWRIVLVLSLPGIALLLTNAYEYFLNKVKDINSLVGLEKQLSKGFSLLLVFLFFTSIANFFTLAGEPTGEWTKRSGYPYNAILILKNLHLTGERTGNLFNWYGWGGFLIWQLPEYKTFIDGRMPSWQFEDGRLFMDDYVAISGYPNENERLLNEYFEKDNITYLLNNPDSAISTYLLKKGWVELYRDENTLLLEKPL